MELLIKDAEDYSVIRQKEYLITISNNADKEQVSFHIDDIPKLIKTLGLVITNFPKEVKQGRHTFVFTEEIRQPRENDFYFYSGLFNEIRMCYGDKELGEHAIYSKTS